ncbi:hypothetical protein D9O50_06905 [Oxalobacteraceae bacterium CAVE-383]|nr:hypothetical protein D9O50_06905 [Oxalobacteraceae bacterium CAVE-383]
MKPQFYSQRLILVCSAFAAAAALSACGQIGPLYLPHVPADPDAPPGSVAVPSAESVRKQQRMPLPGSNTSGAPSSNSSSNPFSY